MDATQKLYKQQGFGTALQIAPPIGLLIVDFLNGFADPAHFGGGNIAAAIERTCGLLAEARRMGWPTAHTRIVFADDGSDANIFSRKVPSLLRLVEGSVLSQIVPWLEPAAGELVVRKTLPSAFACTNLQSWFTQRGVKTLAIAGATTSGCVRASVLDALNAGFVPFVIRDCVGDRAAGPHEANLFDMQQKSAEVVDLDVFLELVAEKIS
jgi:maleamate amidohydrolase